MSVQPNADLESVVTALFGGILAKSTRDPVFREQLRSNPTAVLSDMGLTIPPTITVTVEDSVAGREPTPCGDDHLVLTLPPEGAQLLSDGDLDMVAGGGPLTGMGFAFVLPLRLVRAIFNPEDTRSVAEKATQLANQVKSNWEYKGSS